MLGARHLRLAARFAAHRLRRLHPFEVQASVLNARVQGDGTRVTLKVVVETDTVDRPVMIAEPVYWYSAGSDDTGGA